MCAQQVFNNEISEAVALAHNSSHSALVTGFVHYDGPEYSATMTGSPPRGAIMLVGGASPPASAAEAAAFIVAAKDFLNLHFGYADLVSGEKFYAHKVADVAHTITNVMGAWNVVEAALVEAARVLVNDMCTRFEAHRLNTGGNWHAAIDTNNVLGTPVTFTIPQWTAQIGVERTNYLKALFNDHIVLTSGGVHSVADTGNLVTASNALFSMVSGPDWATWLALLTELRTKLIAHPPTASHAVADNTNIVTAPVPTVPAGTFDLVNEMLTDWNLHVADATYHQVTDAANQTSITTVASISDMVTAAQQLYAKIRAHVQEASLSRAIRRIAP